MNLIEVEKYVKDYFTKNLHWFALTILTHMTCEENND